MVSVPSAIAHRPAATAAPEGLEALRQHPQFDTMRRTVQSNPGALGTVLTGLGQGNPALLAAVALRADLVAQHKIQASYQLLRGALILGAVLVAEWGAIRPIQARSGRGRK